MPPLSRRDKRWLLMHSRQAAQARGLDQVLIYGCAIRCGDAGDERIRPSAGAALGPGGGSADIDRAIAIPDPSVHRTGHHPGFCPQEPARRHAVGQPATAVDFRLSGFRYLVGGADATIGIAGSECIDAIQGEGFSRAAVAVDIAGQARQAAGSGPANFHVRN